MYNWNVDTTQLKKDKNQYAIWKLEQMVNFGLNGKKLSMTDLKKHWPKLNLDLKKKKQDREIITTRIIQATRGGLIVSIDGLSGFLPVSQLSSQKYPQIEGGDRDKILSHLNRFINQEIKVMIIGLDQSDQQIIVSEKAAPEEKPKEKLKED